MKEDKILFILKRLNSSIDQLNKEKSESGGLTLSQSYWLHYLLVNNGKKFYETDIHTDCGLSRASISSTLKKLRQKGYIEMIADTDDDRRKQIILTDKAYQADKELTADLLSKQNRICSGISPEKLDVTIECLNIMLENVKCKGGTAK